MRGGVARRVAHLGRDPRDERLDGRGECSIAGATATGVPAAGALACSARFAVRVLSSSRPASFIVSGQWLPARRGEHEVALKLGQELGVELGGGLLDGEAGEESRCRGDTLLDARRVLRRSGRRAEQEPAGQRTQEEPSASHREGEASGRRPRLTRLHAASQP